MMGKYPILIYMIELILFGISALLGSGILFSHRRALTYIAASGVLFESELLLTDFIRRMYAHTISGQTLYLVAGIIFVAVFASLYKYWKSPYTISGSGKRDLYIIGSLLIILAIAYPIINSNGYQQDTFVLHGFYNGDTVTFASLINKSFITRDFVSQNPFAANGPLEYPTLLHGTFADFFSLTGIGVDWLRYLSVISFVQIIITIPMFFLFWDTVFPEPKNPAELWFGIPSRKAVYALEAILTLVVVGLSLDSFTYPQSHFFLIASFLGCLTLLTQAATTSSKKQLLSAIPGVCIAILLLFANTVTGTVAAALVGTLCFIRIFDKKRPVRERTLYLLLGFVVLWLVHSASNGRASFTHPHFSASAAGDMIRAGLPFLAVLAASIYSLSRKQYIAVSAIIAGFLGLITFFLSDRNIVTENASRFLYHGFLIGSVLLMGPILQYSYFLRRELFLTSRPMSEKIAGWVGGLILGGILFLPIGISAASTYSNLLKNDEHTITPDVRSALWWIDEHTKPLDVIIASPTEPYMVPLFTSKAMLRAQDYWLSLQDNTTQKLVDAFVGNKDAQAAILAKGSYIMLTPDQQRLWDTSKLKKVFQAPNAIIYQTGY